MEVFIALIMLSLYACTLPKDNIENGKGGLMKTKKLPEAYWKVAEKLYYAIDEVGGLISVQKPIDPIHLRPATVRIPYRNEEKTELFVYEVLRNGHIPEIPQIAVGKVNVALKKQQHLKKLKCVVADIRYEGAVALIVVRYYGEEVEKKEM